MKTPWTDNVDKKCPLPEYPRPQLVRDKWLNLNGVWDYCITDKSVKRPEYFDGEILVPFSIESPLSGVEKPLLPNNRLWYRKLVTIPSEWNGSRIILHFGAVDWQCKLYINKELVGSHSGGYCPFSFDITDYLTDGYNEISLCVYDPTDKGWQQRGKQVLKPHGFWYTATSGIWQTVWMEPVDKTYITDIKLTPDIDEGLIHIKTNLSDNNNAVINARIIADGKEIANSDIQAEDSIKIENPQLWSPENPFLYDLVLTVFVDGKPVDNVLSYFGMRKYSIEKDDKGLPRLCLNNEPYFQNGLLDQGYWPDGVLTPPTDEAMIFDIKKMKELGFNMLRKHIKVEPARWYYHCDRMGMLVWQDMISGGEFVGFMTASVYPTLHINCRDDNYHRFKRDEKKWRDDYKAELKDMLNSLYNYVSICCWVPFNEGWGQFDAREIGESIKKFDPTRFVDHASGWHDQGGPDFKSLHIYFRPVFMPRLDGRPLCLTEFGGYSRKISDHVFNEHKSFGYKFFKTKESLTEGYKKLFEKQIIPLIPRGLCATVYTQVSDVELEINGILTYDRTHVKIDEDVIKNINERMKY